MRVYQDSHIYDAIDVENMPHARIFYGFSGPTGRPGGFEIWAKAQEPR